MGGVSPVGAGAHRLRLPAASSCWLLLHQLTPLELRPDAHTVFTDAQITGKNLNESYKSLNVDEAAQTAVDCGQV